MVLYTDAEMTATHSKTVAANRRRSFLRKLIAGQPRAAGHRIANQTAGPAAADPATADPTTADPTTKDRRTIRSKLPDGLVPSCARVRSPRCPPANGKEE